MQLTKASVSASVFKSTKIKHDRRKRENERISRENLKMLKRLNSVKVRDKIGRGSEQSEPEIGPILISNPCARRFAPLAFRTQPEYSVKNFRRQRKKESDVLKLRRTNYTTGHILTANLEPIRTSKLKALQSTSFASASLTSLVSNSQAGLSNILEPGIYIDPEALKHLPKSPPTSRQRNRPKMRKVRLGVERRTK